MTDVEGGDSPLKEEAIEVMEGVKLVGDLKSYEGSTVEEQVDSMIKTHSVVMISKTWCPFSRDAKDLLSKQIGVTVHALEVNTHPEGAIVFKYLSGSYKHYTVPMIFLKGAFVGGCDELKALHQSGELERRYLAGLIQREQTAGADKVETAKLIPGERSKAMIPPFWFPNQVNNWVVRLTGAQVFILSVISAAQYYEIWGRYLAVGLLVDFGLRLLAGSSVSPLGMTATVLSSFMKPDFRPGPPKQFASFCGLFFSFGAVLFYFLDFEGHDIVGAVWMGMLACAAGLEAFLDFCLGCVFFGFGIQFGLIPDSVYRIYTSSRQEIVDSWEYKFSDSQAPVPTRVNVDPTSAISLKYKVKTDEWTKDDFDLIRHMQVDYFAMPLAISGLALAFKVASNWSNGLEYPVSGAMDGQERSLVVPEIWQYVLSAMGAFFFCLFVLLSVARAVLYPNKICKEWDSPYTSPAFGTISITITLYAYLVYDEIHSREPSQGESGIHKLGRVLWWIGSVAHAILTVIKFGEWIGRRFEMEHVQAHWMIFPVGLAVSALIAPIVGVFKPDNVNSVANVLIARFFYSFAWLMWITLFVVTFFKVVTTHNSDDRLRHGAWIWVAAPCILAMAEYVICVSDPGFENATCYTLWMDKYFMGIFLFLGLTWATFPYLGFFDKGVFHMGYWIEVFAFDTLAAAASLFYTLNGYQFSQTIQFIFLTIASIANLTAFWHTCAGVIRGREIFTPKVKWGPLSFMKLTHEACRGNMGTLLYYVENASVDDDSAEARENLGLLAAHFNRFCIVHEEHSNHEDKIIFKTFNDYFPEHAKKWNDDHEEDHGKLDQFREKANKVLDTSLDVEERKNALTELQAELPPFLAHFEEHMRGEEDHLNPIGRKYLPIQLMIEMNRKVWEITDAERWEVIIPFIILGLPRHPQRVRYIKVLTWAMPERAQQIGAIIYRNVDAVMWERLRVEVPAIIPRGAPGHMRYY
ncbi:hypothetical protein ACA910_004342 [Epithemia clementina (nom. ined.)]